MAWTRGSELGAMIQSQRPSQHHSLHDLQLIHQTHDLDDPSSPGRIDTRQSGVEAVSLHGDREQQAPGFARA